MAQPESKKANRVASSTPSSSSERMSRSVSSSPTPSSSSSSFEPEMAAIEARKQSLREVKSVLLSSNYLPPKGMKMVQMRKGKSVLDFDDFSSNPNLELWAVRVPVGIKPRHLNGSSLQLPEHGLSEGDVPVGKFTARKTDYAIRLVQDPSDKGNKRAIDESDAERERAVGQEVHNLVPLLPRMSSGDKWLQAPRPIKRNLIITRSIPDNVLSHLPLPASSLIHNQPSPVPGAILTAEELLDPDIVAVKKVRREQPPGLKMRLTLGGMGAQGGLGRYNNKPTVKQDQVFQIPADSLEEQENGFGSMEGSGSAPAIVKSESTAARLDTEKGMLILGQDEKEKMEKKERKEKKKERKKEKEEKKNLEKEQKTAKKERRQKNKSQIPDTVKQ